MRLKLFALVLTALLFGLGSTAPASQNDMVYMSHGQSRILEGLNGVQLVIIVVVGKHGLREDSVREDVELRLKQAHVHIFNEQEITSFMLDPRHPTGSSLPRLTVYINPENESLTPLVQVSLREDMILIRNRKVVVPVDTWREEYYIWREKGVLGTRDAAMSLVDWFCRDYAVANAKSNSSPHP